MCRLNFFRSLKKVTKLIGFCFRAQFDNADEHSGPDLQNVYIRSEFEAPPLYS